MTITTTMLIRASAFAAATSGLIFIGVQINHPHLELASVGSTEWVIRNALKVVMAMLALAGITGIYVRQVRETGVLGLLGYLLFTTGYFAMMAIAFVAGFVLPALANPAPAYISDVLAMAAGGTVTGDLGLLPVANAVQGIGYLVGGGVFAIALLRAGVLHRWAAALLLVGTLATLAIPLLPHSIDRFLAYPTGVAFIGLGYSLWRRSRANPEVTPTDPTAPAAGSSTHTTTAGAR